MQQTGRADRPDNSYANYGEEVVSKTQPAAVLTMKIGPCNTLVRPRGSRRKGSVETVIFLRVPARQDQNNMSISVSGQIGSHCFLLYVPEASAKEPSINDGVLGEALDPLFAKG